MKQKAVIANVVPGSIAHDAGLECGDVINTVNGKTFCDILDFKYMTSDEFYTLEITKKDGTEEIIEIYNDYFETLGVEFENPLIDKPMLCKNKCVFCFMDQLPPNVRKTMLFKDSELEKCTVRKGDLLICEGGDIGRSAIWTEEYEMRIQNHIHRLRPYIDDICVRFYYYVMMYYKNNGL